MAVAIQRARQAAAAATAAAASHAPAFTLPSSASAAAGAGVDVAGSVAEAAQLLHADLVARTTSRVAAHAQAHATEGSEGLALSALESMGLQDVVAEFPAAAAQAIAEQEAAAAQDAQARQRAMDLALTREASAREDDEALAAAFVATARHSLPGTSAGGISSYSSASLRLPGALHIAYEPEPTLAWVASQLEEERAQTAAFQALLEGYVQDEEPDMGAGMSMGMGMGVGAPLVPRLPAATATAPSALPSAASPAIEPPTVASHAATALAPAPACRPGSMAATSSTAPAAGSAAGAGDDLIALLAKAQSMLAEERSASALHSRLLEDEAMAYRE